MTGNNMQLEELFDDYNADCKEISAEESDRMTHKKRWKMPKVIPVEIKEEVCRLYNQGTPLRVLSGFLKISQNTAMKILREMSVKLRNGRSISVDKQNKVVESYTKGLSVRKIMITTGIRSEQTIYRIIDEYKLERRRNTTKTED